MANVGDGGASGEPAGARKAWVAWIFSLLLAVGVVTFIVLQANPFETPKASVDVDRVATEWNRQIGRLGILPVYPPQEDLHVGDVLAIVSKGPAGDSGIVGRAVRLKHLDVKSAITEDVRRTPRWGVTALDGAGKLDVLKQTNTEVARGKAVLLETSLISFPQIVVSSDRESEGTFSSMFGGFGSNRQLRDVDTISIKSVETYGVAVDKAMNIFFAWCKQASPDVYCNDQIVRTILAYSVDPAVLKKSNDRYEYDIQLRFISRVYTTRRIVQKKWGSVSQGGFIKPVVAGDGGRSREAPQGDGEGQGAPGGAPGREDAPLDSAQSQIRRGRDATPTVGAGGFAGVGRKDDRGFEIDETFQRPVVVGYRAVTLKLVPIPPSPPEPRRRRRNTEQNDDPARSASLLRLCSHSGSGMGPDRAAARLRASSRNGSRHAGYRHASPPDSERLADEDRQGFQGRRLRRAGADDPVAARRSGGDAQVAIARRRAVTSRRASRRAAGRRLRDS